MQPPRTAGSDLITGKSRWRPILFALGLLLMLVTPAVAVIPGPGGVFTFAAGLALVLKNSAWAKRVYVRFKASWPKTGAWADWAMRRPSARRRLELERSALQDAEAD